MQIKVFPSGMIGANAYLVVDETTGKGFIVDPGAYNKALSQAIKDSNAEIEYIILTHGHGDHIGGVPAHQQEDCPNAKIVAANKEFEMLSKPELNMSAGICYEPISIVPDIGVDDNDEMSVGNIRLKFIETPGHTIGGMCILADNVLFSGDTLFKTSIGRTDFPGGSYGELLASIKDKLFLLPDDTQVFPGHMENTTIGYEKRFNPFV